MYYQTFPSSPLLAPYVRFFWALEGEACEDVPYTHRTMANGCPELVFHYKGRFEEITKQGDTEKSFIIGIQGQSQIFRRFSISENFGIFGAFLYPFAIPKLFGFDTAEINNSFVDWQDLTVIKDSDLCENMMNAKDNLQRASILSLFLEARVKQSNISSPAIFYCINEIIAQKGLTNVQQLAKGCFLSERQFERKFKQFSGFSPKLFSRIARFENVLNYYGKRGLSLTQIAYNAGYYDQSHFIRDFKEFSGHHPSRYFFGEAEGTEWKQ
ncbi:helix-turn-helix domain-containing protein [Pinibacter aurantiacus]|uniref:Helix-turn-helix domain-containing protein n=1 Tax=Pinibacter aurantiacus TaxID=2851599 RepID=A0A9E2W848_9BACT|nr:helix-turn-helix domain-containing protein [Pinibacter aurantiacus]MBV4357916.1 helix-turn-helix domain-containing protein [Pinibacter aurantiacus]